MFGLPNLTGETGYFNILNIPSITGNSIYSTNITGTNVWITNITGSSEAIMNITGGTGYFNLLYQ